MSGRKLKARDTHILIIQTHVCVCPVTTARKGISWHLQQLLLAKMSIKHIEFLKVKPSKVLVVEVRPVKCVIDFPTGIKHTAKWMNYGHWKELRSLLSGVVNEYEGCQTNLKVTQEVECDRPATKNGSTIKIGYMFTRYQKCSCHFLTPREGESWTDEEDEHDLKIRDRGGLYNTLQPCDEMLVVSVSLAEDSESRLQGFNASLAIPPSPTVTNTRALDRQLIRALYRSVPFTNPVSNYFESNHHQSGKQQGRPTHKALKQVLPKVKNSRPYWKKQKVQQPSSSEEPDLENENPGIRQDNMLHILSLNSRSTSMNQNEYCNNMEEKTSFTDPPITRPFSSKRKSPIFQRVLKSHSSFGNDKYHKVYDTTLPNLTDNNSVSSWSPSPVLGMTNKKKNSHCQQLCQSDTFFSLRQVDNSNNESVGQRDSISSCQSTMHENEDEDDSQMDTEYESDSLPDLNCVQLAGLPSMIDANWESVTCKTLKKKEKLKKLFGDSDSAESMAAMNNDKGRSMVDFYEDEEYVPQQLSIQRKSVDLFEYSTVGESDNENSTFDIMRVDNSTIKSNSSSNLDQNTCTVSAFSSYKEMKDKKTKYFSEPEGKLRGKKSHIEKESDHSFLDSETREKLLYDDGKKNGENKDVEANGKYMTVSHFSRAKKRSKSKGKSKACNNIPANQPKVTLWTTTCKASGNNANSLRKQYKMSGLCSRTKETFEEKENLNEMFTVTNSEKGKTVGQDSVNERDVHSVNSEHMTAERLSGMSNKTVKHNSAIVNKNEFEDKFHRGSDGVDGSDTLDYNRSNVFSYSSSTHPQFFQGDTLLEDEAECVKESSKNAAAESIKKSYEKLKTMTDEDLQIRLDQAFPYLRGILKGQEPNERHQMFFGRDHKLYCLADEIIYGPFSEDQITYVHDSLAEKFDFAIQKFRSTMRFHEYIWRVLAPTFLIKIVMDNENMSQEQAERLMGKCGND